MVVATAWQICSNNYGFAAFWSYTNDHKWASNVSVHNDWRPDHWQLALLSDSKWPMRNFLVGASVGVSIAATVPACGVWISGSVELVAVCTTTDACESGSVASNQSANGSPGTVSVVPSTLSLLAGRRWPAKKALMTCWCVSRLGGLTTRGVIGAMRGGVAKCGANDCGVTSPEVGAVVAELDDNSPCD